MPTIPEPWGHFRLTYDAMRRQTVARWDDGTPPLVINDNEMTDISLMGPRSQDLSAYVRTRAEQHWREQQAELRMVEVRSRVEEANRQWQALTNRTGAANTRVWRDMIRDVGSAVEATEYAAGGVVPRASRPGEPALRYRRNPDGTVMRDAMGRPVPSPRSPEAAHINQEEGTDMPTMNATRRQPRAVLSVTPRQDEIYTREQGADQLQRLFADVTAIIRTQSLQRAVSHLRDGNLEGESERSTLLDRLEGAGGTFLNSLQYLGLDAQHNPRDDLKVGMALAATVYSLEQNPTVRNAERYRREAGELRMELQNYRERAERAANERTEDLRKLNVLADSAEAWRNAQTPQEKLDAFNMLMQALETARPAEHVDVEPPQEVEPTNEEVPTPPRPVSDITGLVSEVFWENVTSV